RRITATPLEIRPKLKNRHGIQRTLTARILQSVNILLPRPATIQHVIAKLNLDLNGFPIDKLKHEKH
ncbi:hypothetical protein, partial [Acinetobacter radioresistens]|uniref:hypothetical protein n=1 Tax=Acinetobacter radioresistens TaxID=40216 RepID=UPI0021D18112